MNLGSKNIKFTIKKIINDLNDFDKINDLRSFSIAQNIRRKTLRYIIANSLAEKIRYSNTLIESTFT